MGLGVGWVSPPVVVGGGAWGHPQQRCQPLLMRSPALLSLLTGSRPWGQVEGVTPRGGGCTWPALGQVWGSSALVQGDLSSALAGLSPPVP